MRRALQYVRKVSGVSKPSQANQAEFERAVGGGSGGYTSLGRGAGDERTSTRSRRRTREGQGAQCSALRGHGARLAAHDR